MIRNPDGTPYQTLGSVQQFDPENSVHDLFNDWDQEAIKRGGSPIFYYEALVQNHTIDPLYLEDRGKLYSPIPIQLWASYEPVRSQNLMTSYGIDSMNDMMFELNYKAVLQAIGHPPKIGSRIYTPHLRENWKIVQNNTGEFKMWGVVRLQIFCSQFQESLSTGEGKITQKVPDFKII